MNTSTKQTEEFSQMAISQTIVSGGYLSIN
jgi:hypothetical protein